MKENERNAVKENKRNAVKESERRARRELETRAVGQYFAKMEKPAAQEHAAPECTLDGFAEWVKAKWELGLLGVSLGEKGAGLPIGRDEENKRIKEDTRKEDKKRAQKGPAPVEKRAQEEREKTEERTQKQREEAAKTGEVISAKSAEPVGTAAAKTAAARAAAARRVSSYDDHGEWDKLLMNIVRKLESVYEKERASARQRNDRAALDRLARIPRNITTTTVLDIGMQRKLIRYFQGAGNKANVILGRYQKQSGVQNQLGLSRGKFATILKLLTVYFVRLLQHTLNGAADPQPAVPQPPATLEGFKEWVKARWAEGSVELAEDEQMFGPDPDMWEAYVRRIKFENALNSGQLVDKQRTLENAKKMRNATPGKMQNAMPGKMQSALVNQGVELNRLSFFGKRGKNSEDMSISRSVDEKIARGDGYNSDDDFDQIRNILLDNEDHGESESDKKGPNTQSVKKRKGEK